MFTERIHQRLLHRRLAVALAVTALAGGLLTACGGGGGDASASSGDPHKITFGIGSPTLTDSTASYAAVPQALGYWKAEGLDVETQPTQGATASLQLLVAGKADIVNGGSSSFYQAAEKNPEIRVISLQKANIWRTVVPDSSDIKSISDLKGKTIGAQSLSSAAYLFGRAAIAAGGLDPDKDVTWLPVGVGNQAAQALKSKQIAGYATYDGPSGVVGNALGEHLRGLPSKLDDVPGLLGIATTDKFLTEHADMVAKFLIGINKGAVFSAANPSAALQIQWKAHPDQKPRDKSIEDAVQEVLPVVESRFKAGAEPGLDGILGNLSRQQTQQSIDFLAANGIIKKRLDAAKVTDLSINKKANEYDATAVRKQAKDWKG